MTEKTYLEIEAELEDGATPGPWEASKGFCPRHQTTETTIYARPDKYTYVEVVESSCGCNTEDTIKKADARLIAFHRNLSAEVRAVLRAARGLNAATNEGMHNYDQRPFARLAIALEALDTAARRQAG